MADLRWLRLFNRLEAAVSRHRMAKAGTGFTDDADEALHAAHSRILKEATQDRPEPGQITEGHRAVLAMIVAMSHTRDGMWVKDAPTHVFPEFLAELEKLGWHLVQREVGG